METAAHRYFIVNKPYNMVSQFISPARVRLLGELDFDFPPGTHAVGRLDNLSEGLLILTTNKKITRLLFHPEKKHKRTYLVQVQRLVNDTTLETLRSGVPIKVTGNVFYKAVPYSVEMVQNPQLGFDSPYQLSEQAQYSWLKMVLTEGKYHQVRKMVKTVNHRCVRLVRTAIEGLTLGSLPPGGVREIPEQEFFQSLGLERQAGGYAA